MLCYGGCQQPGNTRQAEEATTDRVQPAGPWSSGILQVAILRLTKQGLAALQLHLMFRFFRPET